MSCISPYLYYLCVSTILICGSSRRVPRGASCPSCSLDCPEALASPWYPDQESELQFDVSQNFSAVPSQKSLHFLAGNSYDKTRNNMLLNQDLASYKKHKNFSQQKSMSKYSWDILPPRFINEPKQQNFLPENFPPWVFLSTQKILPSQHKRALTSRYSLPPALPSKQYKTENKNLFYRNPRDAYSIFSSENENFENHVENEDPMSKLLVVYPTDKNPSWEDTSETFLDVLPRNSFSVPMYRQANNFDDEKDAIKKSPNVANHRYDFASPRKGYHSTEFNVPEIKHDPHVFSQDLDIRQPKKDREFLYDVIENSLEAMNQLEDPEDNFYKIYPARNKQTVITDRNNEQVNYNSYMLPQNLNIQRPKEIEKSFGYWNSPKSQDSQKLARIEPYQEKNWSQMNPIMEKNIRYFKDEKDRDNRYFANEKDRNEEYSKKENEKDKIESGMTYNSYAFPQNMITWKKTQDELSDNLDLMTNKYLREAQKPTQLEIYPVEQNEFSQNVNNKDTIQSETHIASDRIRMPVKPDTRFYAFPALLNGLNSADYSIVSNIEQPPETKNEKLFTNSEEKEDEKMFKDKIIVQNGTHTQYLVLPNDDTFNAKKYSDVNSDIKDNVEDEFPINFDPDLLIDVEDPPAEPTEATPIKSAKFSITELH